MNVSYMKEKGLGRAVAVWKNRVVDYRSQDEEYLSTTIDSNTCKMKAR